MNNIIVGNIIKQKDVMSHIKSKNKTLLDKLGKWTINYRRTMQFHCIEVPLSFLIYITLITSSSQQTAHWYWSSKNWETNFRTLLGALVMRQFENEW